MVAWAHPTIGSRFANVSLAGRIDAEPAASAESAS